MHAIVATTYEAFGSVSMDLGSAAFQAQSLLFGVMCYALSGFRRFGRIGTYALRIGGNRHRTWLDVYTHHLSHTTYQYENQ